MASTAYATIEDVKLLWRNLTTDEEEKVEALLPIISDELRYQAMLVNKDLDSMIASKPVLSNIAKEVTVSIISRIMRQSTTGEPMSQESQSGLGYSWSGTYAIAGGGIGNAIMRSDLKRLGLKVQRMGIIDFYDPRNDSNINH